MSQEVVNYQAQALAAAERYEAIERSGGAQFVSTRGGVLRIGDNELPGNQMCVVVIDAVRENTYYPHKFSANANLPPTCYAISRDESQLSPHPDMQADLSYFEPFHFPCKGCPNLAFGTSNTGKGKACSERYRLALLPAGFYTRNGKDWDEDLFNDAGHFAKAEIAYIKTPVTSTRRFSDYMKATRQTHKQAFFGMYTRIWLENHTEHQFHMHFEALDPLPDSVLGAVLERQRLVANDLVKGYEPPSQEALAKASAPQQQQGGYRYRRP